ncbi:hypothetical protein BaRGS_00028670 [Batillaria attramentaria]|uniref:Centromere protein O n=1 Tax=Batillaria attramentaria TaxID=370345 RepID=A0ABD0JY99_9CAEN
MSSDPEKFQEEAGQIYTTVFHKYNSRVRPPDSYPKPVKVNVKVDLIHIRGFDLLKQELETVLDLEIDWQDKRLAWYANQVHTITVDVTEIWSPSIVYLNGVVPLSSLFVSKVIISSEGLIKWYRREVVTTMCPTTPQNATQQCPISLGFTSKDSAEEFDNTTELMVGLDFANHYWDVQVAGIDDYSSEVHFVLDLVKLDPPHPITGARNCSAELGYEVMNGASKGAGVVGRSAVVALVVSAATLRQEDEAETLAQTRTAQKQKQKLLELQERRDNLLEQLQGAASTSGVPGGEGVGDDGSHETIESSELRSAVAYMAELKEKLNVYKLTGASIIKSNQDGKVVCFTTSYKGSYLESYHLKLQGLSTGQFRVSHHDLPPFVFTSCVPDSLEVKDIPSVVQPVREVLSMYVLRREELKSAEGKFSDTLHVAERSGPIDFVCFHMDVRPNLQVEITLKYKDLKHYLPSAVNAVPLKRERFHCGKKILRQKRKVVHLWQVPLCFGCMSKIWSKPAWFDFSSCSVVCQISFCISVGGNWIRCLVFRQLCLVHYPSFGLTKPIGWQQGVGRNSVALEEFVVMPVSSSCLQLDGV